MSLPATWDWTIDGWIIAVGTLCAVASALLGNFLVLRKLSMLGDAISHAVLPGLAAAFFLSDSRNSLPMFLGAVIVGVLTALFTEWIRGVGNVDEGASMGVVFTSLFALGLVMIVQAADHVDLDPSCVLYGAIEFTPIYTTNLFGREIPQAALTLGAVMLLNALFVIVFFKEWKITSFDPALATASGFHARAMHYLLMILVAVTAVASFEAVGNILVVAMFVVPPAAAYMLTDRLSIMILISIALASASAVLGHVAAITIPVWFGFEDTNTAGMMAVVAGLILLVAILFGPRHGVLVKSIRRRLLAWRILADDVVALIYRLEERGGETVADLKCMLAILFADRFSLRLVLTWLTSRNQIELVGSGYQLTPDGRQHAQNLVRSHRLWEQYLISHVGVDADRLHEKAEAFEHFTDQQLRAQLDRATSAPTTDPHGTPIPDEGEPK